MPVTWALSWIAGHWKAVALAGACLALWVALAIYGARREEAGRAAVQARWDAATAKAEREARETEGRWKGRIEAAEQGLRDAQTDIAARDDAIGRLAGELRKYAARPRSVSVPADYPKCLAELNAERHWSIAVGELLAEGADLAQVLGRERDDAVARLWAAAEAWPR